MFRSWPRRYTCACLTVALLTAAPQPQTPPAAAPPGQPLPIRRVVLYKNGVGYFEHLGQVNGNQSVTVPFTSGQLNDALKSLTVLDLNGGRVTGVEYDSAAPVDRQLGSLRLPGVSDKATLTDFLGALRGAKLEVRAAGPAGASLTGRLLSVERKTRVAGGNTLEVDYISLLTDSGELRTTEVSPSFQVRLLETGLPGKVNRMLDLVSLGREPDLRNMIISTQGAGERRLHVSYISEVPVWKSTYRIVLDAKGATPLIQGWAIVDNTVGRDWQNVDLSLVAGAPQSFIQELSQPYYSRRPVVGLPEQAMLAPQTFEPTLYPGGGRVAGRLLDASGSTIANATVKVFAPGGALVRTSMTGPSGQYELSGLNDGSYRLEAEAAGFRRAVINGVWVAGGVAAEQDIRLEIGAITESIEISASSPSMNTMTASRSGGRSLGSGSGLGRGGTVGGVPGGVAGGPMGGVIGGIVGAVPSALPPPPPPSPAQARLALRAAAAAQDLGDLFEYKLKDPITIQKNRSALVPIVHSPIRAEKISVWNESSGLRRPLRALWLENSSGLTLDGGSFSVIEEETFAGEGIFDDVRPAEKRLISYAVDLALNPGGARRAADTSAVTRCIVSKGVMIHQSSLREKKTYVFRNEDTSARTVLVEHPVRPGFQLVSAAQPAETAAGWMRFRVAVPSKQTVEFTVEESKPLEARFTVRDISDEQVAAFLQTKAITPEVETALRRILAQQAAIARVGNEKEAREAGQSKIFDDQQRLRENMKSLKGSAEEKALLLRYTQQLGQQETQLEKLRREIDELSKQEEREELALEVMIEALAFDVKL